MRVYVRADGVPVASFNIIHGKNSIIYEKRVQIAINTGKKTTVLRGK